MAVLDYLILFLYFVIVLIIGIVVNKKIKPEDQMSGGKDSGWLLIGLSVLATQISTVTFIGAPGWSYGSGIQVLVLYLSIPIVMFVCSSVFVPFFYQMGIKSLFEYTDKKFSKNSSTILVLSYIFYNFITLGAMIIAPAIIINSIIGVDIILCIIIIILISSSYTILGGLKAVMITDFIQMILFWIGIIIVFFTVLSKIPGGLPQILDFARANGKLNLYNFDMSLGAPNTVFAGFFGFVIYNIAYYGCTQTQVQRMLTAKSIKDLKYSLWFTSIATVIQMTIFLFLGLMFFSFYKGAQFSSLNDIFIIYIKDYIPVGILGLIISVLFAGSMSSIDSILNTIGVLFVKHIIPHFKHNINDDAKEVKKYYIIVLLLSTVIEFALAMIYYVNMGKSSILEIMSNYGSYLLGSLFGVFILALFFKKSNSRGAIFGLFFSLISLILISNFYSIFWVWNVALGALICVSSGYVLSIITRNKKDEAKEEYTMFAITDEYIKSGKNIKEEGLYVIPFKIDKQQFIPIIFMVMFCILLGFVLN